MSYRFETYAFEQPGFDAAFQGNPSSNVAVDTLPENNTTTSGSQNAPYFSTAAYYSRPTTEPSYWNPAEAPSNYQPSSETLTEKPWWSKKKRGKRRSRSRKSDPVDHRYNYGDIELESQTYRYAKAGGYVDSVIHAPPTTPQSKQWDSEWVDQEQPSADVVSRSTVHHSIHFAWQCTRVVAGSPAQTAGLLPFFDYVIEMDNCKLGPDEAILADYVKQSIGKRIAWKVYNSKTLSIRDMFVVVSDRWGGSGSLLGCTLRWVDVNKSFSRAREVTSITRNSDADCDGLQPHHDWIIGMQEIATQFEEKYCAAFLAEDDFDKRLHYFVSVYSDSEEVLFQIYDAETNDIREMQFALPLGFKSYDGDGHHIPPGAELPVVAGMMSNSGWATYNYAARTQSPGSSKEHPPPGHMLPKPRANYAGSLYGTPQKMPTRASHIGVVFPTKREHHRMRQYLNVSTTTMYGYTAFSVVFSLAISIYHFVLFGTTTDSYCTNPLGVWALLHAITVLFFPLFNVFVLAFFSGRFYSDDSLIVLGGIVAVLYGGWLIAWWIVGNVWTFSASDTTCDPWLYRSCFWWIIGQYVAIGLEIFFFTLRKVERLERKRKLANVEIQMLPAPVQDSTIAATAAAAVAVEPFEAPPLHPSMIQPQLLPPATFAAGDEPTSTQSQAQAAAAVAPSSSVAPVAPIV